MVDATILLHVFFLGMYSLSVRHRAIKHYRIVRMPNNWYYISPRLTFQCLEDLVNHYSGKSCNTPKNNQWSFVLFYCKRRSVNADFPSCSCLDIADGLCCVLTGPCLTGGETPRSLPSTEGRKLSFDWRAVNR